MGGDKGHHQEENQRPHQIVHSRHGDQRLGHGARGLELIDHGQGRRRGGGQGDAAEQEGEVNGNIRDPENDTKYQADHHKSVKGFRDGRDQDLLASLLHLRPDQLRADHQADDAFQHALHRVEPSCVQQRVPKESQRMGPHNHSGDQPAQNGRQFQFGNQLARNHRNHNGQQQAHDIRQDLHDVHLLISFIDDLVYNAGV